MTMRPLIAVATLCTALLLVINAHAKVHRFKGAKISEKQVGFLVIPQRPMGLIAVSSTLHNYFLVLPYSNSWEFESTEVKPLEANDSRFVVTMTAEPMESNEIRSHLEQIIARLKASAELEIGRDSILEEKGQPILQYRARPSKKEMNSNVFQWNYWTAAVHKGTGIVLHISTLDPSFSPDQHGEILRVLLTSLRADFQSAP